MWDGDFAALRVTYMFMLAHICHITPADWWDLTVNDTAVLYQGVEDYLEAQARASAGG